MGTQGRSLIFLPFFLSLIFFSTILYNYPSPAQSEEDPYEALVAMGDLNWHNRGAGADGWIAPSSSIDEAIRLYKEAIVLFPNGIPARWRLMRALYFKGEFTGLDKKGKRGVYDDGIKAGEEALELIRLESSNRTGKTMKEAGPEELAEGFIGGREVGATFFWYSVQWGQWALNFGKFKAARKGVASKIRDLAGAAIIVDPVYKEGGGHRVLGRLHSETPRIPFITGWVSKEKAVESLREALALGPDEVLNGLYLAEVLEGRGKEGKTEAREILEELVNRRPRAGFPVEDRKAIEDARVLLELIRGN